MQSALQKPSHRATIRSQLVELLIQNDIAPGHHIAEDVIASTYGVSRTPVREALILLERQNLVVNEPQRGFFASTASFDGLRSYFDMAKWLYPILFQRGARNLRGELTHAAVTMISSEPTDDLGELMIRHYEFVRSIALAAQNAFAADTVIAGEAFHSMVRTNILKNCPASEIEEANQGLIDQDRTLCELIKSGDENALSEAVRTSIEASRSLLASQSF